MIRRSFFALCLCALALAVSPAPSSAQSWPTRPVRFIVPLGPGSGVDITARLFADKLSARWGQPVLVENRPGGDGMVAITSVLALRASASIGTPLVAPTFAVDGAGTVFSPSIVLGQGALGLVVRLS